jgi:hypothetical protein
MKEHKSYELVPSDVDSLTAAIRTAEDLLYTAQNLSTTVLMEDLPPEEKIPYSFLRLAGNDSGLAMSWEKDFEVHASNNGDKEGRKKRRRKQRDEGEDMSEKDRGDNYNVNGGSSSPVGCEDEEEGAMARAQKRARGDSPSSPYDYGKDERYVANISDLVELEGWDVSFSA